MRIRLYITVSCFGLLAVGATLAVPQEGHLPEANQAKSLQNLTPGAVIELIQFAGLRRIPLDAVKSRIGSDGSKTSLQKQLRCGKNPLRHAALP
jgi:hypothetical protein